MVYKSTVRRKYFAALIVILLAAGAGIAYIYILGQDPTKNYTPKYEVKSSKNSSSSTSESDAEKEGVNIDSLPNTTDQVPASSEGTIDIVDLNQATGFVNAKASTANFVATKCVYQFTSDGAKPVVRESENCNAISVPQADFEKIGTYSLTVTAYNANMKLVSSPKEVYVN